MNPTIKTATPQSYFIELYDFEYSDKLTATVFDIVLAWYEQLGFSPGKAQVMGGGHSGKYITFANAYAKVKKIGLAGVESFLLSVLPPKPRDAWDCLVDVVYGYDSAYNVGKINVAINYPHPSLAPVAVLKFVQTLLQVTHAQHGMATLKDAQQHPGEAMNSGDSNWDSYDYPRRTWRIGRLREIYPWIFISEKQWSQQVDGVPLLDWIKADARRGEIISLTESMSLWAIDWDGLSIVRAALSSNGLLYDREKSLAEVLAESARNPRPPIQEPAIPNHKAKLVKRNKLIGKIMTAGQPGAPNSSVVGLKEFFDGNWDEASLAPNKKGSGRPSLKKCHRLLRGILGRDDVQDVLVGIYETPDPDDEGDIDMWPISDTVYIVTSASLEEVEEWTNALSADETSELGRSWKAKPYGAPDPQPNMKIFSLWWD